MRGGPRPLRLVVLLVVLLGLHPPGLPGQQEPGSDAGEAPPLDLSVDPRGGTVRAVVGDLFASDRLVEALRDGLPVRMNVRVELWRSGGIVDRFRGQHEWRAGAIYDPVSEAYELRIGGPDALERRSYGTLDGFRAAVRDTLSIPLRPEPGGRYYYLATLEVETLSLSDLEELQRWLRGELAPSVRGEQGVGSALAGGLRRLLVRILGLPVRRYRTRTPVFRVPGEGL